MQERVTSFVPKSLKALSNSGVRVCVKDAFSLPGAALAAALAFLCVGCGGGDSGRNPGEAGRLSRARALWAAAGVQHYTFTVQRGCFCRPEYGRAVRIEVDNKTVVSINYTDDGTPADPAFFNDMDTVEELFGKIEEALTDEAAVINKATYDDTLGYLKSGSINWAPMGADGLQSYNVYNLERILEPFSP